MIRCVEIRLTIPDNEAYTAFATLARMGVPAEGLSRADVYCCEVDDAVAASLADELRACEGVFNPNKHTLVERTGDAPVAGEVWIGEAGLMPVRTDPVVVSGRTLGGVRSIERFTAWNLTARGGRPATRDVVEAASAALLCNPAFQVAYFEDTAAR